MAKKLNSKKIAQLGVLTGLSVIMFIVESLFPPFLVPGARLGLGNIFILLILIWFDYPTALLALIAKCLIVAVFGGPISLLYSIPSGIISFTVSFFFISYIKSVSIVAVGSVGAVLHNLVQNAIFAIVTKTEKVLLYAPYLAILGVIAGTVTGLAVYYLSRLDGHAFSNRQ